MTTRQPISGGRPEGESVLLSANARDRVLARRRLALIALVLAPIATLAAAIMTGSWPILAASLVFDVLLAGYVAILLQIKQGKSTGMASGQAGDVRAYGR